MLMCTVRDCRLPLVRGERQLTCARGHSFDVARSGYVNLLQPQERRSKNPGDSALAVAGRRRVYDLGIAEPLLAGIVDLAGATASDVVLDAGCGDGYYLAELARRAGTSAAHGLDISIPAIESAAKRYPEFDWIVGNADRLIPWADGTFSLILSITARMNTEEFRRVLRDAGRLLVALPAPGDLIELRGAGREDRVARTVETFAKEFTLVEQRRASTVGELAGPAVEGLLASVYRPLGAVAVATRVTFSLDLLLFQSRG